MISSQARQPQQKTKVKSSETAGKPARKPTGTAKGKGNPLDIPLKDFSPEVRDMLVAGMVKGGRARIVKRKQSKQKKNKLVHRSVNI